MYLARYCMCQPDVEYENSVMKPHSFAMQKRVYINICHWMNFLLLDVFFFLQRLNGRIIAFEVN